MGKQVMDGRTRGVGARDTKFGGDVKGRSLGKWACVDVA